ncbi:MAG: hypothetical protein QM664_04295, partial [Flavihumibacter sp.]
LSYLSPGLLGMNMFLTLAGSTSAQLQAYDSASYTAHDTICRFVYDRVFLHNNTAALRDWNAFPAPVYTPAYRPTQLVANGLALLLLAAGGLWAGYRILTLHFINNT